jgi:methylated-DNA-[protein]-cysteine S-methyltransferase
MTDATVDTGLDSEIESALRTGPGDARLRPPQLSGEDVTYALHDSSVGRLLLARRQDGTLLASRFSPGDADEEALLTRLAHDVSPRILRNSAKLDDVRRAFDGFLAGDTATLAGIRVDLALATPFQREVLPALAAGTGYGQRTTYGALAARIGRPSASRAVGAALGANPLCIVIPCHRVVASSGSLTGYAGGLAAKEYLLDLEATHTP